MVAGTPSPRPAVSLPLGGLVADEELVVAAAGGDEAAFETLIARYQDRVYSTLARMNGMEDAEDLAQETFLKAYRALGTFRQGSKFYTWLFRIAVNTAFSRRRQDVRRKSNEGVRLDAPAHGGEDGERSVRDLIAERGDSDPSTGMDKELIRQRVREGLEQIDPDYRDILVLRDMNGLDYDAIAETLSLTCAAVKSRLHRARQEMARLLKDLADEV